MDKQLVAKSLIALFALAGAGIMTYLVYLHFAPVENAFCSFGEGLSCSVVNTSVYAKVFGIPVSILGLLYFLGVLGLVVSRFDETAKKGIALATIAFLGPSLYLSYIEFFVIENICVFCEASKVLMAAIAGVALYALWPKRLSLGMLAGAVVAGLVLAGASYASHANIVPEGTYTEFAQCVDEAGLVMYGSEGCSFCARQRALFGDAFEYINEIECDPRFDGAQVELCVAKDIAHTPTWIQEDASGNTLKRFDPGVVSLRELSEETGCELPE